MTTAHAEPKGILILHPNHWLFHQLEHPKCDSGCGQEIFPLTPVEIEDLENGQVMFWHASCWERRNDPTGETG